MVRVGAFGLNTGSLGLFLGWSPGDLRDLEKYSQKGLRGYTVDTVNQVFLEEERRFVEIGEFLGRFCLLDRKCTLWHLLWQSGGARSFSEIHALAGSIELNSKTSVSKYLSKYVNFGLAEKSYSGKYRMIGPRWIEYI